MPRLAFAVRSLVWIAVAAMTGLLLYAIMRARPEDMPWTRLDLARPIGLFTGRKLTALGDDPALCRSLLVRAGVPALAVAPVSAPPDCGYRDGVRLSRGTAAAIVFAPAGLVTRCGVAASISVWEWEVVQPAAIARFGRPVTAIEHYGSYACRRIAGGPRRAWSEHATANAIDVAGFRLSDGRRITVARDWKGDDAAAGFLHDVRDGACRLFATVLSPDYNAAHRDHLHLDQASRGLGGWRGCR